MHDIAIIGGGIIGTSIARELSKFNIKIIMLEKENDVSNGTTKANSGIVHAGYDAEYGSNMATFNVRGNELYSKWAEELDVPFKRIGSLVVAHNEEELKILEGLKSNGELLGVPNLEIISGDKVRKLEANLRKDIVAALYAPTAGIVEPWEMAIGCAENAVDNGAELKLNFKVNSIVEKEDGFIIKGNEYEEIRCKMIINAAGVYADDIYNMICDNDEFKITPRRGQYYLLDREASGFVNHVIFPTPTKMGKGTLITPTADGNVLVGPDSENLDLNLKESTNTTGERLELIKKMASNLTKSIPYGLNITTFSGLRAEPTNGDFIIEESKKIENFINVAGIKSPGLSSAPAIAEYVGKLVEEIWKKNRGIQLEKNSSFNPMRRPKIKFNELSIEEKQKIIKENPSYGNIVCRCEKITEGEIIDVIHRSVGGATINGIKRRVRPGAGRCQGGFCGPRVLEILSKELNLPMEEILQENKGSHILTGKTKA